MLVFCTGRSPIQFKCLVQDSILPSRTKKGARLVGEFCSLHLLKVNSSARGLTFALDGSGRSSSHPVCLIPGKEPLVPSEYDVWVSEQVWTVSHRENHLYLLGIEFQHHSDVACSLIMLSPLTARSKYASFPSYCYFLALFIHCRGQLKCDGTH